MEVMINSKISFAKRLICDIIRGQKQSGRKRMEFTGKQSILLHAVISDGDYMKIVKKEPIKNPINFYEYSTSSKQKGYTNIIAEISLENMLDMLKPNEYRKIQKYEAQCNNKSITFNNEQQLIESYIKNSKLHLLRYCEAINKVLNTQYIIKYKVIDIACIKRVDVLGNT